MVNIKYSQEQSQIMREEVKQLLIQSLKTSEHEIQTAELKDTALYDLFDLYDKIFFQSKIIEMYNKTGYAKLKFRFSQRMSGSAGITVIPKKSPSADCCLEIAISRNHLRCFDLSGRDKEVGGIPVQTAHDALLLVFEHELCHLIEFLIFGKTNCKQKIFKTLAYNYFGHIKSTHLLPAHKEINLNKYDFRPGDKINFTYHNKNFKGTITKINKHATVMSPDPKGAYIGADKRRYKKFYVPMNLLYK